jgi:hypothetical protein
VDGRCGGAGVARAVVWGVSLEAIVMKRRGPIISRLPIPPVVPPSPAVPPLPAFPPDPAAPACPPVHQHRPATRTARLRGIRVATAGNQAEQTTKARSLYIIVDPAQCACAGSTRLSARSRNGPPQPEKARAAQLGTSPS